ncbi:DUF6541 family protein [Arthrobacter sp. SAFR-179]|uniref:DUF6541 family protein n=1 Tax=Arthrobacter sp. SAFR-179 TaxID=3387279 RepID=UPI003F7BF268
MLTWLPAVPSLLVAFAIVFVPGALLGWGLRLRGITLYALAPLFTTTIVAVGPILFQLLGLRWDKNGFMITALVSAAAAAVVGRLVGSTPSDFRGGYQRRIRTDIIGLGLGAVVAAIQFMRMFGQPQHISQTADNIFHLNAIRYIVETGSGSSLQLGGMTGIPFYPAAWHTLGALIVEFAGVSVPVAVSSLCIVTAAAVWPAAVLLLARQVCPRSPRVGVLAGLVAASFPAQPILLAMWGVLYPNLYSTALLPLVLALLVRMLGFSSDRKGQFEGIALLCLIVGAPGIALAHPGAVMALIAMGWPLVIMAHRRAAQRFLARMPERRARAIVVVVLVLAGAATVALWGALRPEAVDSIGPPVQSLAQALGQIFLGAPMGGAVGLFIAAGLLGGLVIVTRVARLRWLLALFGITAFLFIAVSSFDRVPFREYITGVWYNDAFRVAALLPVVMAPIVLVGFDWFLVRAMRLVGKAMHGGPAERRLLRVAALAGRLQSPRMSLQSVVLIVFVFLFAAESQLGNMRMAVWDAQNGYNQTNQSELLSTDEERLLMRVAAHVPKDAVIAANPWTGASLVYAYTGRRTPELHTLSTVNDDMRTVDAKLREARRDPQVCGAVDRLNVGYVLDFGTREFRNFRHENYDGLLGLDRAGVAHVIDQEGGARLLKLDVCGGADSAMAKKEQGQ